MTLRCTIFVLLFCICSIASLDAQPTFAISPTSGNYTPNEEVCLDFYAEDFRNLVGFAFPVTWNKNALQFKEIRNINLAGLQRSDFDLSMTNNGSFSVVWEEEDFFPLTLNDGFVLFKACFQTPANCGTSTDVQIDDTNLSDSEDAYANTAFSLNDEIVGVNVGFLQRTASVVVPCECDLTASITSTNIVANEEGYIDLCPGDVLEVSGTIDFPPNANPTNEIIYLWNFGDGTEVDELESSHVYTEGGIYSLSFRAEDSPTSCSSNIVRLKVRVAAAPDVTLVEDRTYCPNELIELNSQNVSLAGGIATEQNSDDITSVIPEGFLADTLAIPDGQGEVYQSSLMIDFFEQNTVIQNGDDIVKICANMEHSWARDLRISLLCPNGESLILHDFVGETGNRIELGEPVTGDNVFPTPGIGHTYCWTLDSENGTIIEAGTANGVVRLPSGDYSPVENFDRLLTCPLNGNWTLQVEDLWAQDNGYIFNWGILFKESLLPNGETYSPSLTSFMWLDNPAAQSIDGENISLIPTQTGLLEVPYVATNEVGCTFEGSVELLIENGETCDCSTVPKLVLPSEPRCASNDLTYSVRVNTDPGNILLATNGIVAGGSGFLTVYNIPKSEDITITITNSEGCEASAFITAPNCGGLDCTGVVNASISGELEICAGETTNLTASDGVAYAWNVGASSSTISVSGGTFSVTITDANGCTGEASVIVTEMDCRDNECEGIAQITGETEVCVGERTVLTASGGVSYAWSNFARSNKVGVRAGTYTVTVTDTNGCEDSTNFTVTETNCVDECPPKAPPQSTGDQSVCASATNFPALSVTGAGVNTSSEIRWYDMPEGGTLLARGFEYTPSAGGTYYAEIYDTTNACSSPRRAITLTILGCEGELPMPVNSFGTVEVQPNPFVEMTTLQFDVLQADWVEIQLYDLAGKLLFQTQHFYEAGKQQLELEARQLGENGIYFYRLQSGTQMYMGKLILQQ